MLNANYNAIGIASSEINGETHWVIEYGNLKNITPPGNAINATQNVTLPGYTNSPDRYTDVKYLNGTWQYIKNGAIDNTYTGLCKHYANWYYVKNGQIDWTYTGLCNHNGTWYYIQNGVLNLNYNGLCKYANEWWHVRNGKVDFTSNILS